MSIDPDNDPRADAPTRADERATLVAFLRWQRDTLELKCSGLDATGLARRSVDPSTLSLLGLVRHLAEVERGWFRRVMAGQDAPPLFTSDTEPDGDFDGAVPDPEVVAQAWEVWRAEVAFADRFVAEAPDLDVTGRSRTPGAGRCRCAGCWCTWWRSTPGTTATPTCCASERKTRRDLRAAVDRRGQELDVRASTTNQTSMRRRLKATASGIAHRAAREGRERWPRARRARSRRK